MTRRAPDAAAAENTLIEPTTLISASLLGSAIDTLTSIWAEMEDDLRAEAGEGLQESGAVSDVQSPQIGARG